MGATIAPLDAICELHPAFKPGAMSFAGQPSAGHSLGITKQFF
jgi:hypothetical protein